MFIVIEWLCAPPEPIEPVFPPPGAATVTGTQPLLGVVVPWLPTVCVCAGKVAVEIVVFPTTVCALTVEKALTPPDPPPEPETTRSNLSLCATTFVQPSGAVALKNTIEVPDENADPPLGRVAGEANIRTPR